MDVITFKIDSYKVAMNQQPDFIPKRSNFSVQTRRTVLVFIRPYFFGLKNLQSWRCHQRSALLCYHYFSAA